MGLGGDMTINVRSQEELQSLCTEQRGCLFALILAE